MTSAVTTEGPLQAGARVGLQLPQGGTCAARIGSYDHRTLTLELVDEAPECSLEVGSILDLLMPRSVGMYKWLCIVSSPPSGQLAELQILDGPMFIQRRLDPRVGANLLADVRHVRSARRGLPHRALVADLSHGGLKLEGARPARKGDTIEVTMELCGGQVAVLGRVVMAYPSPRLSEAGSTDAHVCFLEGQRQAIEAVDRFVAQQLACRWRV
jgi:hypothetical protein